MYQNKLQDFNIMKNVILILKEFIKYDIRNSLISRKQRHSNPFGAALLSI